eukprot:8054530-Prorocentrum_lima.AAC.1
MGDEATSEGGQLILWLAPLGVLKVHLSRVVCKQVVKLILLSQDAATTHTEARRQRDTIE